MDIEQDFVGQLKDDREKAVRALYRRYQKEFYQFAQGYSRNENMIADAYQEGMIAFYEYCLAGKYDPSKAGIKTLLFTMSKYALFRMLRKSKHYSVAEVEIEDVDADQLVAGVLNEALTPMQERLKRGLANLGEQCQKIIRLFYYFEFSISAIAEELGYQNENVVRSHKSRCMKRLRGLVLASSNRDQS